MKTRFIRLVITSIHSVLLLLLSYISLNAQTKIEIIRDKFLINGKPTYEGIKWNGHTIEGLLFNARMVQGVFDDLNSETKQLWKYPDTKTWDPDRNTNEFVEAMDDWYNHGLLAFTLNLQGGSPTGYGNKGWKNSAFDETGELRLEYINRLYKIIKKADDLGMVVFLGLFYFGQDEILRDELAVINAVDNILNWLFKKEFRNVIIEVNNECDIKSYDHEILKPHRVHELIQRIKKTTRKGYRFFVGTSFKGKSIPTENVVEVSDLIFLHGNGVSDPKKIKEMVEQTRSLKNYKQMPIVFNEDDHFDFDKPTNNFIIAIESYSSWGYFDYRMKRETDYREGYQSIPVDWQINSERKKSFFNLLKTITCTDQKKE